MRIEFHCKTNKDYVMINTAYAVVNGYNCRIDRDLTEYSIEGDSLSMDWSGLYIHEVDVPYATLGDDEKAIAPELYDIDLDSADITILGFEIEDDAEEDYFVELIDYSISFI